MWWAEKALARPFSQTMDGLALKIPFFVLCYFLFLFFFLKRLHHFSTNPCVYRLATLLISLATLAKSNVTESKRKLKIAFWRIKKENQKTSRVVRPAFAPRLQLGCIPFPSQARCLVLSTWHVPSPFPKPFRFVFCGTPRKPFLFFGHVPPCVFLSTREAKREAFSRLKFRLVYRKVVLFFI